MPRLSAQFPCSEANHGSFPHALFFSVARLTPLVTVIFVGTTPPTREEEEEEEGGGGEDVSRIEGRKSGLKSYHLITR
jgi:hypothetical protein